MKRIILSMIFLCLTASGFAQKDSSSIQQPDTIIAGKFIIIRKNKTAAVSFNDSNSRTLNINIGDHHRNRKKSNISTNWLIFDLGFANYTDNSNYQSIFLNPNSGPSFSKDDFRLNTFKSSNVNIWLFMQKINVSSHVLNLKYGFGLNMYNFRYQNNISYSNNPPYVYSDSVNFSKDKLYAGYLTVPLMFNINTAPHSNHGFSFSGGVSAGYLVGSHTKQISSEHGKQKLHGDFDLNPWRFAYVAEMGLGFIHLYGSYSINPLHSEALMQYPYAVGIRFSNW